MPDGWREKFQHAVEAVLPWYSATVEAGRDRRTEAIRRRSIAGRKRAERLIAEYRAAELVSDEATERLITEVRRDDDR